MVECLEGSNQTRSGISRLPCMYLIHACWLVAIFSLSFQIGCIKHELGKYDPDFDAEEMAVKLAPYVRLDGDGLLDLVSDSEPELGLKSLTRCASDGDCSAGMSCFGGACRDTGFVPECGSDGDCPAGESCLWGECQGPRLTRESAAAMQEWLTTCDTKKTKAATAANSFRNTADVLGWFVIGVGIPATTVEAYEAAIDPMERSEPVLVIGAIGIGLATGIGTLIQAFKLHAAGREKRWSKLKAAIEKLEDAKTEAEKKLALRDLETVCAIE